MTYLVFINNDNLLNIDAITRILINSTDPLDVTVFLNDGLSFNLTGSNATTLRDTLLRLHIIEQDLE